MVLGGRYELVRRIAVGGMGEVWLGRDQVLGRDVAIKILKDELVGSTEFLEHFRAEARHTASLSHPGIAAVFDYREELIDGRCTAYLVMELVDGEPLSDKLEREGALAVPLALSIVAQCADALHAAHRVG